jgi:hypothetical protein
MLARRTEVVILVSKHTPKEKDSYDFLMVLNFCEEEKVLKTKRLSIIAVVRYCHNMHHAALIKLCF